MFSLRQRFYYIDINRFFKLLFLKLCLSEHIDPNCFDIVKMENPNFLMINK